MNSSRSFLLDEDLAIRVNSYAKFYLQKCERGHVDVSHHSASLYVWIHDIGSYTFGSLL